MIFLNSCSVKEYTPTIPSAFDETATVSVGAFDFECEICRNENVFELICLDTNAKNLKMTYDGADLMFSYTDFDYTLPAENFERTNPVIILYEVFALLESDGASAVKTESGFRYTGTVAAGDFILLQSEDNSLISLEIPTLDFSISFQ